MDRAGLNALITQALDAMDCERCHAEFYDRVARAVVECASTHNTTALSNMVHERTITAVEAFDRLTETLRPLYSAIGQEVSEKELNTIRRYIERRAGANVN
ncbi:hypothetical protein U5640_15920 [Streptomyces sp. SS7]|uniref:hypothetical protein n=1 Tax=Streptomyces sp. SS7 TaxID=3108485 RepID=UPI0030EDB9D6